MTPRWKKRPDGSNWGDFGPDDKIGRLNLLTPARRLKAVSEVKEGIAFALSLPLDFPGGTALSHGLRHPPKLFASRLDGVESYHSELGANFPGCCDISCDDVVTLHTQYSTQWDSLAHWGQMFDADGDGVAEKVYYNGYRAGTDLLGSDEGGPDAGPLGIDHMVTSGVQGRGVLVNLQAAFGPGRVSVRHDMLQQAIAKQGVTVLPGDFLLLYAGLDEAILGMNRQPDMAALAQVGAVLDGSDRKLLDWITHSGIAAICSDNSAIEGMGAFAGAPKGDHFTMLPLHEHCLFKLGIHLGELWYLRDLAAWLAETGRHAFLLTAPPLRLPGAAGSPVTPIATV